MGRPIRFPCALAAASATGIALSQTLASAGQLALTGALVANGVAVLATGVVERAVLLTFAGVGNNTVNYTIRGLNASGGRIVETIAGPSIAGTVVSTLFFQQVDEIESDAPTTGALSAGTTVNGGSGWLIMDRYRDPFNVSIGATVDGTVNYTIQHTYDDLLSAEAAEPGFTPAVFDHPTMAAETTAAEGIYDYPVSAIRVTINSGTGTVEAVITQAGLRGG